MGWVELRHWRRELVRSIEAKRGEHQTTPDSWEGRDNDAFWQEQDRIRRERRGG